MIISRKTTTYNILILVGATFVKQLFVRFGKKNKHEGTKLDVNTNAKQTTRVCFRKKKASTDKRHLEKQENRCEKKKKEVSFQDIKTRI